MARIQQDLRDHTDVPVANVRWLEEDPSILDAPFYVMDRLDGRVPDESPKAYHPAGWVSEATTEQRRQLWQSTLDAMAELHRLDVATHFGYLPAPAGAWTSTPTPPPSGSASGATTRSGRPTATIHPRR